MMTEDLMIANQNPVLIEGHLTTGNPVTRRGATLLLTTGNPTEDSTIDAPSIPVKELLSQESGSPPMRTLFLVLIEIFFQKKRDLQTGSPQLLPRPISLSYPFLTNSKTKNAILLE